MCSITTKRYIFNFELNRRVPNGMHGGVRGRSKSALLDYTSVRMNRKQPMHCLILIYSEMRIIPIAD